MLDAGGEPAERDGRPPVLRPVYRSPVPRRPESRPLAVWAISAVVALLGLYGGYVGVAGIVDAADHGADEETMLVQVFGTLLSAAHFACGCALFAGLRWGRTGATWLCAVNFALAVVGALAETLSGFQVWLRVTLNLVLFIALLGPRAHAWTDGDAAPR